MEKGKGKKEQKKKFGTAWGRNREYKRLKIVLTEKKEVEKLLKGAFLEEGKPMMEGPSGGKKSTRVRQRGNKKKKKKGGGGKGEKKKKKEG